MNQYIESMLKNYNPVNIDDKKNAIKEVIQEMVLCGLSRAGFFENVAFYGGTALRIFYGLNRFSEDLDFSLKTKDENFSLDKYLPTLEKEIRSLGLNLRIEEKAKTKDSNIKSAFLKGNTQEHLLLFYPNDEVISTNPDELVKIKFEVDTNPPDFAEFETQYRLLPSPYEITLYDKPSLFAGKLHAVICRDWKTRVKGRDLYDYIFYLQTNSTFNLKHLKARLVQSGFIPEDKELTLEDVKAMLCKKFDTINYEQAKEDVKPFIKDHASLNLWSASFFKDITKNLKIN